MAIDFAIWAIKSAKVVSFAGAAPTSRIVLPSSPGLVPLRPTGPPHCPPGHL